MGGSAAAMERVNSSPASAAQDSGPSQLNPQKMADFVNKKIYQRLQLEFRNKKELTKAVVVKARDLRSFIDPSELQNQFNKIEAIMHLRIGDARGGRSAHKRIQVDSVSSGVQTPREIRQLRLAFTETKYVGNAHVKFAQYLRRCYNVYGPSDFKAPSVEVAQSSGFGKSRMIRELAVKAKDDQELNMKVLYTCIRMRNSTGYPKATPELIDWLFEKGSTVQGIAKRLKAIFHYAIDHWDTVQTQWLGLFTDTTTDGVVAKALEETLKHQEAKATDKSASRKKKASDKLVLVVIDEARHLVDNTTSGLDHFQTLQRALVSVNNSIGKEGAIFGVLVDTNPRMTPPDPLPPPHKVDSSCRGSYFSRNLPSFRPFVLTHTMDACWQQYCRDQLEDVKGVLMDTRNSDDKTNEKRESNYGLGATDVAKEETEKEVSMSDQLTVYKRVVAAGDENEAWDALKRMGRLLWRSTRVDKSQMVTFAANKLMLGVGPWRESHFTVHTMFGVASMLCRLGVRPCSTSALASRAVANFMATLAYVTFKRDAFLSSYTSEPVLTFGAVKVWYECNDGLVKYILPQLKKLILSDVLDSGGVEEVVACILMLLVMDKCVMDDYGCVDNGRIGELVPVEKFLEVLQVEKMQLYTKRGDTTSADAKTTFVQWLSKWKDWYVGFTHFVQLVLEPDEDTLWYLLGRRAAGVFPRGQNGAYLLIPLFKRQSESELNEKTGEDLNNKVSLLLVKVKTQSFGESEFTQVATKELTAWFLFDSAGDPLSKMADSDVIRIDMDVGEEVNGVCRFIYASPLSDNLSDADSTSSVSRVIGSDSSDAESWCGWEAEDMGNSKRSMAGGCTEEKTSQVEMVFTLCFRSINCDTFPFLSEDVAAGLASLVESAWLPTALMAIDLESRDRRGDMVARVMPKAELQEIALKGLTKVPGHEFTAAKRRVGGGRKREKASADRGEFKKIRRAQDN